MMRHEIAAEIHRVAVGIQRARGIPHRAAMRIATRAALRVGGATVQAGLGIDTAPSGVPQILTDINAAGQDSRVIAARQAVSNWSWLIPVGGLLMSLKRKISAGSPQAAAFKGVQKSLSGGHR